MWTFRKLVCFSFIIVFVRAAPRGDILLVAHNHDILVVDVESRYNRTLLSADSPVVAFDIHHSRSQLFWATESTIYRTPLYDPATRTSLAEVGRVGTLAVDWVHHHLYWTDLDHAGGRVEAAHLDGRRRRVVHRPSFGSTMGDMVLDPLYGRLFWIEWDNENDNETRIMSCNLDGFAKRTFYKSELIPRDSPLAIDITQNSIYFYKVASNGSELWDVNFQVLFDGTKLFGRTGGPPSSVCLAKDGFYFSNKNGTYSIKWQKKTYTLVYGNSTDHVFSLEPAFRLLDSRLKNSSQIRVASGVSQPRWPDHCAYHQCHHGCIVQPGRPPSAACICRYGHTLSQDNRTCEERGYLIYSSGKTFGRISIRGEDNTVLYNDSSVIIQAFDVDVASEYVYWSDLSVHAIYRAPIEQLTRKEVVVAEVFAYGLVVDWLHQHVYWAEHTRILVASVHGTGGSVVVKDKLHKPANMAVDPIDKYIFWVECGKLLSIKRAGLDGSNVTKLVNFGVTCGMSLTADQATHTLFILDWAGAVSLVRYDGSGHTRLRSDVVRGVAIVDHQPLWAVIEYSADAPQDIDAFFRDQLKVMAHDLDPGMVKVVKGSHQPSGDNVCAELECPGVCLPTRGEVPRCFCSGDDDKIISCRKTVDVPIGKSPNDYLTVVEVTPFSATLQCAGPLMRHNAMTSSVLVEEVDSLVPREAAYRMRKSVKIDNQSLPFTVERLNPATTYHVKVLHRVTRASWTLVLHTPPPPLAVWRLPIVTVPGIPGEVPWDTQGVHYDIDNPWERLVSRKYFLLLLSNTTYTQADPPAVPQDVQDVLNRQMKSSFIVLKTYISEDEYDDDPEMYLANLPWGDTFQLAMVQATEYSGSYNLDTVYSRRFGLPDPTWRSFAEEVLHDQSVIDSIERL